MAALVFVAGRHPLEKNCVKGAPVQLTAKTCANVWPTIDPKFRWPDFEIKCPPGTLGCDSPIDRRPQTLHLSECDKITFLSALPNDHLAMIRCEKPKSQAQDFYINADLLSCSEQNTAGYPPSAQPSPRLPQEDNDTGALIVTKAELKMRDMNEKVSKDTQTLMKLAMSLEPRTLFELMENAHEEIGSLLLGTVGRKKLNFNCDPLDGSRLEQDADIRAQRTCRLLRLTYARGARLFEQAQQTSHDPADGLMLRKLVSSILDPAANTPPNEALAIRMLLFYALLQAYPDLPSKLLLIRESVETGQQPFWELHSGFVFGGRRLGSNSGGGYDCTDFIASLLLITESEREKEDISTWMLKRISRKLDGEPIAGDLSTTEKKLASCFSAVSIRKGENLMPGDFIISHSHTFDNGHATIVRRVFSTGEVETIEVAGGNSNAVTYKRRPLFEPQPECPEPEERLPVRPDLYVLRVKAKRPKECPLALDQIT